METPHLNEAREVVKSLGSDSDQGLTDLQAADLIRQHGPNELVGKGQKSPWAILLDQVKEVMVIILVAAALVSGLLHEYIDAAVIMIIVVLNTALGFWQELNAEKAMAALKKLAVPNVRVKRGGEEKQISAKELVPGDMIIIESGNLVPADARLVNSANLKAQEAALTGEAEPVEKSPDALSGSDIPLGDRRNMVYMGTTVTYGRGHAVVTSTGMKTELGGIATMLQEVEDERTPLQKRLDRLGKSLAAFAGVLIAVVAVMTHLRGAHLKETLMTAISMAVAAIPEGLPAVVTIALALGAQRMLKKKSLIRNLPAVETLGSVTVVCSDKTGTLTQNRMTVTQVVLPPDKGSSMDDIAAQSSREPGVGLLLAAGSLCSDAALGEDDGTGAPKVLGDPTEGALVSAAERIALHKNELSASLPRVAELPFDSERKRMTTVHAVPSDPRGPLADIMACARRAGTTETIAFTKGSVDGLMEVCTRVMVDGAVTEFTDDIREAVLAQNTRMAQGGVRVLGAALRFLEKGETENSAGYEKELVYLGMCGMIDPVRPEAVEAVAQCRKAGVRVVMITGDHPLTASAIAKELGIGGNGKALTGRDLSSMSSEDLRKQIGEVSVYARVSPEHKMILIDALQESNEIVSMTGDGVNDAPALKSADIGVAMGITGTDVSKESSDMVLLDDNFATIVAAVKEGRTIYDNIRKFIKYILTGNTGEIAVMLSGPILGMPIPLLPIQILWINLVTDGAPAVALGYEEAEDNVMERPPYRPKEGVFSRGNGRQIITTGLLVGALSVLVGLWFWKANPANQQWQTIVFTTLTFCQMAFAMCVRKNRLSIFASNPLRNKPMVLAVLATLVLQVMLVYVPFFNTIFKTEPLSAFQLGVCGSAALVVVAVTEIEKLVARIRG